MNFLPASSSMVMVEASIPLILVYLRLQAIILIFPVFSERVIPTRVRISLAMVMTPVVFSMIASPEDIGINNPATLTILAFRELLIGFLIVAPIRIMALAMHILTSTIAATASLSQLIGTGTEAAPHPIGNLMHMAGLALLMAMGLPYLLIELILQGFIAFPLGKLAITGEHVLAFVGVVSRSFVLAMALAAPFILGGLLYQTLTGVVNRVMPSLPMVFIGAPAIILLALIGLAVLSPVLLSIWAEAVLDYRYLP